MIIHPNFDPIAISIGPLSIHWYGVMYLLGFLAGLWLGRYNAAKQDAGLQYKEIIDLLFYTVLGVLIGGRLGFAVFYHIDYYLLNPLQVFAIWKGGMSFHGGLLGVLAAIGFYAFRTGRSYFEVSDFLAPLIPPGLFFGRIGNFINQELWGRVADVPWAVMFHTAGSVPRHPSQIYEALLEGVILFLIMWCFSRQKRPPGAISGLFLLGYGVFRFFVEFYREPDGHLGTIAFDWLTMGQILSIPMIFLGLYLMTRNRVKLIKT